jgi:two-component system, probable response regulator PhcQ
MRYGILIVDDEEQVREIMKRHLEQDGYDIFIADGPVRGLEVLSEENIDVVISDYKMPGLTGTDFLSMVRHTYPDTERILITAYGDLEMAMNAINTGEIYRFFTKPCNFVELSTAVGQALERRELFKNAKRLFNAYKAQSMEMKKLEKQHPGLMEAQKTDTGSYVIESDAKDIKVFLNQVDRELNPKK